MSFRLTKAVAMIVVAIAVSTPIAMASAPNVVLKWVFIALSYLMREGWIVYSRLSKMLDEAYCDPDKIHADDLREYVGILAILVFTGLGLALAMGWQLGQVSGH